MPEDRERITRGSPDTPKHTSEPQIAAYEFASNGSTSVSENVDGRRIFLATFSVQPQPAPAS